LISLARGRIGGRALRWPDRRRGCRRRDGRRRQCQEVLVRSAPPRALCRDEFGKRERGRCALGNLATVLCCHFRLPVQIGQLDPQLFDELRVEPCAPTAILSRVPPSRCAAPRPERHGWSRGSCADPQAIARRGSPCAHRRYRICARPASVRLCASSLARSARH
jgi:hypothetical protein